MERSAKEPIKVVNSDCFSSKQSLCLVYSIQLLVWLMTELLTIHGYTQHLYYITHLARLWMLGVLCLTCIEYLDWKDQFAGRQTTQIARCLSENRRPGLVPDGGAKARYSTLPIKLQNPDIFKAEMNNNNCDIQTESCKFHVTKRSHNHLSNNRCRDVTTFIPTMDHLHMSFIDYLWLAWFLKPTTMAVMLFGGSNSSGVYGILKIRILEMFGYGETDSNSKTEIIIINLILNTVLVTCIRDLDNDMFCELFIPSATYFNCDETVTSGDISLKMDLKNKKVIEVTFSGKSLNLKDALILIVIALFGHAHPVMHSFANWGIDPHNQNTFLQRMAICTIKYNNIGMESFPKTVNCLKMLGITKYIDHDAARLSIHQTPHTVPKHTHLLKLKKISKFVDFIIQVRTFFMSELANHQEDFMGIDREAFFLGTVMHSLDHSQYFKLLQIDNFRGCSEEFKANREFATLIFNCFADTPHFRLFECRFSHAPHVFFRNVYQFAANIDRGLADAMECTIAS